eukprot:scaffold8050_cov180-Amphora_coffeaeformis.AAC.2
MRSRMGKCEAFLHVTPRVTVCFPSSARLHAHNFREKKTKPCVVLANKVDTKQIDTLREER